MSAAIWGQPHYVYRCYGAAGELLYVGCTARPRRRMYQHKRNSHWFADVARTRFTVYADHHRASQREAHAIVTERPLWNKNGLTPNPWNMRAAS